MNLEKLVALCAACLFAATTAVAAEWSEFDPNTAAVAERLDLDTPAAAGTEDELHASGGQTDKPADEGDKNKSPDSKS